MKLLEILTPEQLRKLLVLKLEQKKILSNVVKPKQKIKKIKKPKKIERDWCF